MNNKIKNPLFVLGSAIIFAAALAPSPVPAANPVDPALEMRIKAVNANPNEPRNHYNLGIEYYNREMLDQAAASFQKAINTNKKNKEAHADIDLNCYQILGHIALAQNKFPDAAKWFREGSKNSPADPECMLGQGRAYYYANNFEDSREALTRYLALVAADPKAAEQGAQAYTMLGDMADREKKYTESADAFRSIITKYPAFAKEAKKNLTVELLKQGDEFTRKKQTVEAARMYDEAVTVDTTNPAAFRAAARAHYEMGTKASASAKAEEKKTATGHYKLAAQHFRRASALDDKDFESAYFEGLSRYYLEQFTDMITAYRRALTINPSHAGARYNLALALYRQGQFEDAKKEAEEAVKLQPDDAAAIQLQARIHDASIEDLLKKGTEAYTAERFGDAIVAWEKVLSLDPHNPDAKQYLDQVKARIAQSVQEHTQKGEAAYDSGDMETAYSEWSAALAIDPQNADVAAKLAKVGKVQQVAALRKLAKSAYDRGDVAEALSKLDAALALNPKDAQSLKLRSSITSTQRKGLNAVLAKARAALRSGNLTAARREAERAREMSQGNKEVNDLLITVGKRIDDTVARKMAEGQQAVRAGNREQARKSFEAVLALAPDNAEANAQVKKLTGKESSAKLSAEKVKELRKKGINAYLMGRLDEAKKAWEQVLEVDKDNDEIRRYLDRVNLKLKGTKGGKSA